MHRLGVVVLVLGLLAAVAIYIAASTSPVSGSTPDFSGDRRFNLEMERIGGKSSVYVAAFDRWLASLWHGTTLAFTVGVLSVVVALVCFWLSNLMSYAATDDTLPPTQDA